jgi:UDP-glucose 4-epimerase
MVRVNERVLVTGAAGFIGSAIAARLVRDRQTQVVGIDSFTHNDPTVYPRWIKEANLARLQLTNAPNFSLLEEDLLRADLPHLVREDQGFQYIVHQAATAGVRASWGEDFTQFYVPNNISATQRLLEAAVGLQGLRRFVYASSSSVYGIAGGSLNEEQPCLPYSPYGLTKYAAELLCRGAYQRNFGVPTVSLRYFSVYGPGHRPDMAFHQLIRAAYTGERFVAHLGGHERDFTYVGDVVTANVLAMRAPQSTVVGKVYNVGGGQPVTLDHVIGLVKRLTRREINLDWIDNPPGNVTRTEADLTLARQDLGYTPQTNIEDGLRQEVQYIRELYRLK